MISKHFRRVAIMISTAIPMLSLAAAPAKEPAVVMMMGVFHFANPGLDAVKSDVIDVMTDDNQAYLDRLAKRLAEFHPTDVLLECASADQAAMDKKLDGYRKGSVKLGTSEIDQIGLRVAKEAGVKTITCFDEQQVSWDAETMFNFVKAIDPKMQAYLDTTLKSISERQSREQSTLTLRALLQLSNDAARDRENKDLYISTNVVDAGGRFSGADAASSWWHRNFRMYANVQKAAAPGHRVLVVAGSGHTAILKDLLAIDTKRQSEDVRKYLTP